MKNLLKKVKENKKTALTIAGFAIMLIIMIIAILVLPRRAGDGENVPHQVDLTEEEVQAQMDASGIILKEVVVLKNAELSKNVLDYINFIPDGINMSKLTLDTSEVDTEIIGDYIFIVEYYEAKISGTIHVVDNEETLKELMEKYEKEWQETQNKVTENTPVEEETKTPTESENKKPSTTTTPSTSKTPSSNPSNAKDKEENPGDYMEDNGNNDATAEKEQPKALTGTRIDRNIVSYDYGLTTKRVSSDIVFYSLPDYHGEFWYTFAEPVALDMYGGSALTNWGFKLAETIVPYGLEIAKKEFGEDSLYCVKDYDEIFAKNKYEDVVGVIAKYTIGKKDEYDSCSIDNKTVYANNRIAVKHDIENFTIIPA